MKVFARTREIGGSIVVTIPKILIEFEGIKKNQLVEIDVKKPKKSFFGICKGIGPFTEEDKFTGHD